MNVVAFESSLGWMAAAFDGAKLLRLVYARKSPAAALAALEIAGALDCIGETRGTQSRIVARLQAYADGADDEFGDVQLDLSHLAKFSKKVVRHCRGIPAGTTLTYGQLAKRAGSPRAARAVGNVMKSNRFPLIVPCHRVVGSAGSIGGYSAPNGIQLKRRLLAREGVYL